MIYRSMGLRYVHAHNIIIDNLKVFHFHKEYLHDHFERFIRFVFIRKFLSEN